MFNRPIFIEIPKSQAGGEVQFLNRLLLGKLHEFLCLVTGKFYYYYAYGDYSSVFNHITLYTIENI